MSEEIQIRIKLIGAFSIDRFKEQVSLQPVGTRVADVVEQLRIPQRVLGTALVNGVHSRLDAILSEGDTLALLPILGGG